MAVIQLVAGFYSCEKSCLDGYVGLGLGTFIVCVCVSEHMQI